MTKETLTNAIIEECNKSFSMKDPITGALKMITDMHHMYSDIFCLVSRFEKNMIEVLQQKKKKRKSSILE